MSDMADMMFKKTFLDICRGIEGLCADQYHNYSIIYEEIPEVSRLWEKTALEEENHQKQFDLALRLCNETEFEVLFDSMRLAHSIQYKLMERMNISKKTKPDLLTAISKAVEMEENLANMHAHTSLKFKEDSMQKLFVALSEADRDHVAELRRYQTILSLPLSEMSG